MKQKNFHTIYSAADIQKYLEGKLSAAEMHAMEKAALEDTMLADAIEGMAIGYAYYQEDVQRLREKLFQNRKRRIVIAWSTAAAVVIALVISGTLIMKFQREPVSKQGELATATIAPKHNEQSIDTVVAASPDKAPTSLSTDKPGNHAFHSKKKCFPDSVPAQVSILADKEKRRSAGNISMVTMPDTQKVSDPLLALEGRVPGILIQQAYSKKDTIFRGYVKDNNGVPLSGALVRFTNNKETTISDQNGAFALKANPGDSSIKVQVRYIGYQPVEKMIALSNGARNEIVLNQAISALDEVTVKGYNAKKSLTKRQATYNNVVDNTGNAQPITGWKAYMRYLEKQKRKDTKDISKKGTVIVRFYVDSKGEMSDFHVDKSLSYFYDQEAIRLVKAGPGWKLTKGEREAVALQVEF